MSLVPKNFLSVLLVCFLLPFTVHAEEKTADLVKAKELISAGKAAEAYALLAPYEFFQAGDIEYDYLLALAALDSGKSAAATLAFERVLAIDPSYAGARLDFARSYFILEDLERAEEQFRILLTQNPPPGVKQTVDKYLERIAAIRKAKDPSLKAYVESVVGYDSNITNVTRDFTSAVFQSYSIPGLQATGNSIPRDDFYVGINGNAQYTLPVDDQVTWYFGVDGKQREYFKERKYRSTTLSGNLGLSYKVEQDTFRVGLNAQRFIQEGQAATTPASSLDSDVYGIGFSWARILDPRTQVNVFSQFNFVRYGDLPISDNNSVTVGASITHGLPLPYQPVFLASIFHTNESALNLLSNGADFSREVVGFRLAGQLTFTPQLEAFAVIGHQFRDDKQIGARKPDTFGRDTLTDISVGLNWKLDKNWSLRPRIAHTENRSNIPLFSSRRTDIFLGVRRDLQ